MAVYIPVVSPALEALSNLFQGIPGSEWITGAAASGAEWLGDVAKTKGGQVILVGITNAMLFPGVANLAIPSASGMQFVGPQVASLVWAIPGMVAGDSFVDAYAKEVTWRTAYIAQLFGGEEGKIVARRFLDGIAKVLNVNNQGSAASEKALNDFNTAYSGLSDEQQRQKLIEQSLDYDSMARREWVRYDSAAAAINAKLRRNIYDIQSFPVDGSHPSATVSPATSERGLPSGTDVIDRGASYVKRRGGAGRDLTTVIAPSKPGPVFAPAPRRSLNFTASSPGSKNPIGELSIMLLLTSPAWLTFLLLRRAH